MSGTEAEPAGLLVGGMRVDRSAARDFARRYLDPDTGWAYPAYDGHDHEHARGPLVDAEFPGPRPAQRSDEHSHLPQPARSAVAQAISYRASIAEEYYAKKPLGVVVGERQDNEAAGMVEDDDRLQFISLVDLGFAPLGV